MLGSDFRYAELIKVYVRPPKHKRKGPGSGIDRDRDGRTGDGTRWERPASPSFVELVGKRVRNRNEVRWGYVPGNEPRPNEPNIGDVVEVWVPFEQGTVAQGAKDGKHRPGLVVGRYKGNDKYIAVMPFTSKTGSGKRAQWGAMTAPGKLRGEEKQSFALYSQVVIVDGSMTRRRIDRWLPDRTRKYISRIQQVLAHNEKRQGQPPPPRRMFQ